MAANYSTRDKSYNKQYAAGFIAYMMVGSMFRKCICKNKMEASHLYMHYREMPQNQQFSVEDSILSLIHGLDEDYQNAMQDLKCEVVFQQQPNTYLITFTTGGFGEIRVSIDRKGRFELTAL